MAEQVVEPRAAPIPEGKHAKLLSPADYAEQKKVWNGTIDISYLKLPERQQQTSFMLNNPPQSFPGAADVKEVVSPQNPAFRIFHVRDYHGVTEASAIRLEMAAENIELLSPDLREKIKQKYAMDHQNLATVQTNIQTVLNQFSRCGITQAYREGCTPTSQLNHVNILDKIKRHSDSDLRTLLEQKQKELWEAHELSYKSMQKGFLTKEEYQQALHTTLEKLEALEQIGEPRAIDRSYLNGTIKEM